MRYRIKPRRVRVVSQHIVILTTILFVLAVINVQNAEAFHSHKRWPGKYEPVSCGDMITSDTSLFTDLDCSGHSGGAAITLQEGANLNMNGKKIIGNSGINCIEITGDGVKVREGTVTQCDYGIRVRTRVQNSTGCFPNQVLITTSALSETEYIMDTFSFISLSLPLRMVSRISSEKLLN